MDTFLPVTGIAPKKIVEIFVCLVWFVGKRINIG